MKSFNYCQYVYATFNILHKKVKNLMHRKSQLETLFLVEVGRFVNWAGQR